MSKGIWKLWTDNGSPIPDCPSDKRFQKEYELIKPPEITEEPESIV